MRTHMTSSTETLGLSILPITSKAECVHARKGQAAAACASHSGEITLAGSRRLRSTLAAAPVLSPQAAVTETEIAIIINP